MRTRKTACAGMLSASLAALLCAASTGAAAQSASIEIDADDIGGVVAGAHGPEAGVWVIAETRDLPTKYVKIVVTDDQGRYVLPDLPRATYDVWVRGYGLIDSPRVKGRPGDRLDLRAIAAPTRAAAAQIYPAIYWYSMLKIPEASEFPGTGPQGNGIGTRMRDQGLWLRFTKTDGCIHCHQIGDLATRVMHPAFRNFSTSADAWTRRLQSGQAGRNMMEEIAKFDSPQRIIANLADWSDRIARGELPKSDPVRPTGLSRNIVVTQWDWADPKMYLHDSIATDKRNPTINANGLIYGAPEASTDLIPWLDPVDNRAGFIKSEWRDPNTPSTANARMLAPSPYWGEEYIWDSHTNMHNPMFDEKGRVWITARIRPAANPDFCKAGSSHPSAKVYPKETSNRQVEVYDPKTQKIEMVDLCFQTHHLQFDKDNVLWFSSGGNYDVIGWLDVNKWDETKDEAASQGWSPYVLDINGNGRRDEGWVEPNDPIDPAKDKRVIGGLYGVGPNPQDGSIWGSMNGFPGAFLRYDPKTQLTEIYEFPYKNPKAPVNGFSPRGSDIGSDGVVWAVLASGHLASFDRRLCTGPLSGPALADPQNLCPEGFRLYQMPGPEFENLPKGTIGASAEAPYYVWVDQHNILGLGENVPIATLSQSDALGALVDGKWVVLHVPYPMSFYPKNLDGRIDDPNGGWKGRAVWTLYSGRSQPHLEGGFGQTSKVVKIQLRGSPLDK